MAWINRDNIKVMPDPINPFNSLCRGDFNSPFVKEGGRRILKLKAFDSKIRSFPKSQVSDQKIGRPPSS